MKVTKGKHKGKTGKVYYYHAEGDGGRLTLISDGKTIYVSKDEIDFKFKWVDILVMMEDEERAEFNQLVEEIEKGGYQSS